MQCLNTDGFYKILNPQTGERETTQHLKKRVAQSITKNMEMIDDVYKQMDA